LHQKFSLSRINQLSDLIGFSEADITPKDGESLYSLDGKTRNSKIVHSKLKASCFFLNNDRQSLLIISVDLIWVDAEFTNRVKKWCKKHFAVDSFSIYICASHSHSTPQISTKILNPAQPDINYLRELEEKICNLIKEALDNQISASLIFKIKKVDISINRRKKIINPDGLKNLKIKSKVANRPNFFGPKDDQIFSIWVYDKFKNLRCVIINYASHPSIYKDNAVSSDYPGAIREALKKEYGSNLIVCFLQGFCGNIKPKIIENFSYDKKISFVANLYSLIFDRTRFQKNDGAKNIESFSDDFVSCFRKSDYRAELIPTLKSIHSKFELPISGKFDKESIIEIEFSLQKIAKNIIFCFISGEIFSEYSIKMRKISLEKGYHLFTIGYTNDIVGYIPDKNSIRLGGYEVNRTSDFAIAGSFEEKTEKIIIEKFTSLINEL